MSSEQLLHAQLYAVKNEMTEQEFYRRADQTRLRPINKEAAKLVLVHGLTCTHAGESFNPPLSRQVVNRAVNRIRRIKE